MPTASIERIYNDLFYLGKRILSGNCTREQEEYLRGQYNYALGVLVLVGSISETEFDFWKMSYRPNG